MSFRTVDTKWPGFVLKEVRANAISETKKELHLPLTGSELLARTKIL